jgi:hypothetical protein
MISRLFRNAARPPRLVLWALGCILWAGNAAAQAPPEDSDRVDQAREAFVLGTNLAKEGEWPEALNAFSRSSALRPHPVTTYDMAYCERAMGHYTRARKLFRQSLSEHEQAVNGTLPSDLLALAKGYLPEVERRLAHAFVQAELDGATISVDSRPLERDSAPSAALVLVAGTRDDRGSEAPPASSFELLLDPGRHLIVLSRPSAPDKVISETFDAGSQRSLMLRDTPGAGVATPPPSSNKETWTYVAYGVAGAGLVTGSVFGILALVESGNLSDNCDAQKMCDPKYQSDLDAANRNAIIADVGFGVAIAGAAVGTYLLLSGKPDDKKASARVVPWIGPAMLGARGEF